MSHMNKLFQRTLVVIDSNVDNYQMLVDGVIEGAEVFVLDSHRDGVQQITEILQTLTDQPTTSLSLHIVSHGAPGTLYLGNGELSLSNLSGYAEELKSWAIDELLLYGCNVAAGDAGEEFIKKLKASTEASIAASTTLTGSAALGGNWVFDVQLGESNASHVITAHAQSAYTAVLNMTVTQQGDATTLLNALLGTTTGLSNFKAATTGDAQAFGIFDSDPFGLSSGIVISTGTAVQVDGPNSTEGISTDLLGTDLLELNITFDADSSVDKLFFNYVFGSDEFIEFAGGSVNDKFELLVNGVNLAKLSNGNDVTINNLVPDKNDTATWSTDFINNTGGADSNEVQLDGYTQILTLEGALIPNSSNTLTIRIQDVGDEAYDSAVFIGGNSLGTVAPPQNTDTPPTLSIPSGSTAYTGAEILVSPDLTITDPDTGDTLDGATVLISTNFNSITDRLGIDRQSGTSGAIGSISWSFDTKTGVLILSGTASTADYQSALRQVTFYTTGTPAEIPRTVDIALGENLANSDNGHFYEFVSTSKIDWADARDAAAALTYFGLQGYLTTVTSEAENEFIASKLQGEGWMGSSDEAVEGEWRWVTGPEAGNQFWSGDEVTGSPFNSQYNNWANSEPNDSDVGGEDYGHFLTNGEWNDYRFDNSSIAGYVVEYGGSSGDPTLDIIGNVTINVNTSSDSVAPSLQSITASSTSLILTYDEALDGASNPEITDFVVNVNGSAVTVNSVDVDGTTVTVTLATAVTPSDTITASYTPGNRPIQDAAGNDADALSGRSVTNNSVPDTQAPTLQNAAINGTTLVLTYDEVLDGTSDPATTDFVVNVNGSAVTVDSIDADGKTVTVTLATAVTPSDTITASYTPGNRPIQDAAGNDADALSGRSVTNDSVALTPQDLVFTFEQYVEFQQLQKGIAPIFDEELYLLAHPDVQAAVKQGSLSSGLQHYNQFGKAEGRSLLPLDLEIGGLKIADFVDEVYYLQSNPDVAAAVGQGRFANGFEHFLQFGINEGRNPSSFYDEEQYLALNPDVKAAVDNGALSSGLAHFIQNGHIENRKPSDLFEAGDYLLDNPDVQAAVAQGGFASAFEHYLEAGASEARLPGLLFAEKDYLIQYSDVAESVAVGNLDDGFEHFITYGIGENRSISSQFDNSAYLNANPDVAAAIGNGLSSGFEHYFQYGRFEERPLF